MITSSFDFGNGFVVQAAHCSSCISQLQKSFATSTTLCLVHLLLAAKALVPGQLAHSVATVAMLTYLTMSASSVARNLDHCLNSIGYFTRVQACWDSGQFITTAKYLTLLARQHWQPLATTLQDFQFNSLYSKVTNH